MIRPQATHKYGNRKPKAAKLVTIFVVRLMKAMLAVFKQERAEWKRDEMKITIDNLDGLEPQDYTYAVPANAKGGSSLTVQRGLNVPTRCSVEIVVGAEGLAVPARHARVVVTSKSGATLFTGYVATEPVREYVSETTAGITYRARVTAVSDEWLLDKLGSGAGERSPVLLPLNARSLLTTLTERVQVGGSTGISVASGGAAVPMGAFAVRATAPWSENAGAAAGAAYTGYRALGGVVTLTPAASVTHALSDADGTLNIAELTTAAVRELANDVTVSGEVEPAAYITECFEGDGTTTVFELSQAAFRNGAAARALLRDSFDEAVIDPSQWSVADPGSHFSLTSAGLTMNGGTGVDGQTTVTALDAIEMGGSIVAQLGGVKLAAASDGMLAGFYEGTSVLANCFAGFRVRQTTSSDSGVPVGVTGIVPVVNGAEVGTVFAPTAGHTYTLRVRLHCVEMQRVMQRYYCRVDGVVQSFGASSGVNAPMDVVFELVDEGSASNTPATVLYDSAAVGGVSAIAGTPATTTFVVANAVSLFGSIASVSVTRPGSMWVVSTLPSGSLQTRLVGVAGQGLDCEATYGTSAGAAGRVTFFAGRVPVAGERVSVMYRGSQRAVARLEDTASVAGEAAGGAPGTCRWLGKVLQPVARSSADCESAAQAILAFATSRAAAVAGEYSCVNPADDIWPGDVLAVTSAGVTTSLLVRGVTVSDGAAGLKYEIKFANDWATEWADGMGLRLSEAIAADAVLPQTASGAVLASLQQLAVTTLSGSVLGIDAGVSPPMGGGFEVRRVDEQFGVGVDAADLVLRSPVRNFSIPRAAQGERFYVRMYDGSGVYSRFSSAVFVNWAVS